MSKQNKLLVIEWDLDERDKFKALIKEIKKRSENLAQRIKEEVKEI